MIEITPSYTIRIITPPGIASSVETLCYSSREEASNAAERLAASLRVRGYTEYVIHVLDTESVDAVGVVQTFTRALDPTRVDARRGLEDVV